MEQSAENNNINSGTSPSKSDGSSPDDGEDDKGSDDIKLSKPSPDDGPRSKTPTAKLSISRSECPSTSTNSDCRDLSILSNSLKVSIKMKRRDRKAPAEKRKFLGDQNEIKSRKRHKAYQPKNTVHTQGKKRKATFDNIDGTLKRSKPAFENDQAAEKKPNVTQNTSTSESGSSPNNDKSSTVAEDTDGHDSDEVEPCTSSCVCQAGPSNLPLEVERKFDTPEPLYRSCLLRRMYSLANTQYICCEKRCVKKHSREKVLQESLFHMKEDYYISDMALHQYKWGEWKE